jgi:hypothetical protein
MMYLVTKKAIAHVTVYVSGHMTTRLMPTAPEAERSFSPWKYSGLAVPMDHMQSSLEMNSEVNF